MGAGPSISASALSAVAAVAHPVDCSDVDGEPAARRELKHVRTVIVEAASSLGGARRAATIASKVETAEAVASGSLPREAASAFRAESHDRWEAALLVAPSGDVESSTSAVDELQRLRASLVRLLPVGYAAPAALLLEAPAAALASPSHEEDAELAVFKQTLSSNPRVAAIVNRVVLKLQARRRARQARQEYGLLLHAKYEEEEREEEAERQRQIQMDLDAFDAMEQKAEEGRRKIVHRATERRASFHADNAMDQWTAVEVAAVAVTTTADAAAAPQTESEPDDTAASVSALKRMLTNRSRSEQIECDREDVDILKRTLSTNPRVAAIVNRVVLKLQARRRARQAREEYGRLLLVKYEQEEREEEAERERQLQADLDALDHHHRQAEEGRQQIVRKATQRKSTFDAEAHRRLALQQQDR